VSDQAAAPPTTGDEATAGGASAAEASTSRGARLRRDGLLRAGVLSMVGLIALGSTRLVHMSLVTRATDKETVATVGSLITLAMAAGLFLPGGLASAASRFIPFHLARGDVAAARRTYRRLTLIGYAGALGLAAVVALIGVTVLHVDPADAIGVAALTAVYAAYSVAKGALYGFDRVTTYTWLEIAGSAVTVAVTVVVVVTGATAYLVPLVVGYAVLMVGSLVELRRRSTPGPDAEPGSATPSHARRELATFVWLASLGGFASGGLLQALPTVVGRFAAADEVAYVVAAVTLVGPLYFLPRALSMALFPTMARAHGAGDVDAMRRHVDVFTRALLVLLAPLFAAGILLAPEVLTLFGGSPYAAGAGLLQVLLLATYVVVIQVAAVNYLSGGDGVRIPVYSSVAGALVGLALVVPFGSQWGAAGVGVAYLVAVTVGAAGPLFTVWRRLAMGWTGPAVRSFAVVGVALVAAAALAAVDISGATSHVVTVLAAVVLAVAGSLVLRRDLGRILSARRGEAPAARTPS
jgi:O-antigen/teichoic acid export membrane protein